MSNPVSSLLYVNNYLFLKRKALSNTEIELKLIAAAANIGLNKGPSKKR